MDIRSPMPSRRAFLALVGIVTLIGAGFSHAGSWTIEPSVEATETYSSNMGLVGSNASVSPVSGWISELTPRFRVDGAGSRLNAFLDYRREFLHFQDDYQRNHQWNLLQSHATVEAVDNWLFVDASANIDQQPHSVFDTQSMGGANNTRNQSETRTTQIAPYIRGRFASIADYLLRLNTIDARFDDPAFTNTHVDQLVGSVKNYATTGAIGWFGDFTGTKVRNAVIGKKEDMRFRAGLVVPFGAHAHVSAFGGRESTDYASSSRETTTTPGIGLEWSPSKRTQFVALRERRFFGYGHDLLLAHHTARMAWRYSDSKDAEILPTLLAGYDPGSTQQLMSDLLEASIPDPNERSRVVRARMEQSATAGIPRLGGVQTTRLYLNRARELSVARVEQRNTLSIALSQRDQELLPFSPDAIDDFADSSELRERTLALVWLHRLTRQVNLHVSAVHLNISGTSESGLMLKQNSLTAALTFRLSRKAVASLGVRRSNVNSTVTGHARENALAVSLSQGF
ncbi:MAG: TIGR03016 family PEP-CTERM system-associated outer membrane protein [Gammaproteobacteria bacterium]|nr:TIGR03016 family PEP-CTERM system-associated outer membrane protein [Gammaproteobacteria bacterium]MBU1414882.1 TIGR03016 family PEP-CTERM system-associated outer membrane protein [Gammaproteobacteria bacterium]